MHRVQAGAVQAPHLARACAKDRDRRNLSARHRAMHRRKWLAQGFRGVESWDESLGVFSFCSFLRISVFKLDHSFEHCRSGAGLCAEPLLGGVDRSFLPWVSRSHSVQPGVLPDRRGDGAQDVLSPRCTSATRSRCARWLSPRTSGKSSASEMPSSSGISWLCLWRGRPQPCKCTVTSPASPPLRPLAV